MKITIRITRTTISFTARNTVIDGQTDYEQYNMKTGISVAANLRQALADCHMLQVQSAPSQLPGGEPSQYHPVFDVAHVVLDTPLLLIPAEEFDADSVDKFYHLVNTAHKDDDVTTTPVPALNVVAAYAVNKDLRFVLTERFRTVQFVPLLAPVLVEFSRHAYGGFQDKLFCYFHDKRIDICAFRKSRIRFCSSFDVSMTPDAIYYILNTWKTLAMRPTDILCLAGNISGLEMLNRELHRFIKNIKHIAM